jgi:chromosome segregation ATPase
LQPLKEEKKRSLYDTREEEIQLFRKYTKDNISKLQHDRTRIIKVVNGHTEDMKKIKDTLSVLEGKQEYWNQEIPAIKNTIWESLGVAHKKLEIYQKDIYDHEKKIEEVSIRLDYHFKEISKIKDTITKLESVIDNMRPNLNRVRG